MSIVRALANAENGRAYLKLVNGSENKVTVESIIITSELASGRGEFVSIQAISLEPGESAQVEVTADLLDWLNTINSSSARLRIQLSLNPEPPSQPAPGLYWAERVLQGIARFESAS